MVKTCLERRGSLIFAEISLVERCFDGGIVIDNDGDMPREEGESDLRRDLFGRQ
jgi:hypothetical protein